MPCVATRPRTLTDDLLETATGFSALSAGVLWFSIYLITENAPELCTTTPRLLAHCALCYPAAFSTLGALIGVAMLLHRRRAA